MIKIPPCDLPMPPLAAKKKNVQGFLVIIGKNGTIGRFADFTIGKTPNVANIKIPNSSNELLSNKCIGHINLSIYLLILSRSISDHHLRCGVGG